MTQKECVVCEKTWQDDEPSSPGWNYCETCRAARNRCHMCREGTHSYPIAANSLRPWFDVSKERRCHFRHHAENGEVMPVCEGCGSQTFCLPNEHYCPHCDPATYWMPHYLHTV